MEVRGGEGGSDQNLEMYAAHGGLYLHEHGASFRNFGPIFFNIIIIIITNPCHKLMEQFLLRLVMLYNWHHCEKQCIQGMRPGPGLKTN